MTKSYIRRAKEEFKQKEVDSYFRTKAAYQKWEQECGPDEEELRLMKEHMKLFNMRSDKAAVQIYGMPTQAEIDAKKDAYLELKKARELREGFYPAPKRTYPYDDDWLPKKRNANILREYDGPFAKP